MRRLVIVGALLVTVPGCYSGVHGVVPWDGDSEGGGPDPGGTSGGEEPEEGEGTTGEPLDPEVGDCDASALSNSTLRRLNRREYEHTVQDLFGLTSAPEVSLPWDDLSSRGLDNDGSSLALDQLAAEQYYDAALEVADRITDAARPPMAACEGLLGGALHDCVDAEAPRWLELAFRRPPDAANLERLLGFVDQTDSYAEARDAIVVFTLTSPSFLFHYKPDAHAEDGADGYLLADRLSYLLWSSTPDATLLEAAGDGSLMDEARLEAEVERMLADPRSARFFRDFADLWLQLGVLRFKPGADEHGELYADMRVETQAFFEFAARENLPLAELLTSNRTYVNDRLAAHYGMPGGLDAGEWAWLEAPPNRRGLLLQGSILAAGAGDGFSHPIGRGSWVAEHIVCNDPPLPEGGIPPLPPFDPDDPKTMREILEEHREDPACAACHALMDPYGLAMENYDHLGAFRTEDGNGLPIEPADVLPSGVPFADALEMVERMSEEPDFERCATEYVAAYGVGRALDDDEACFVDLLLEAARAHDAAFGFRDLLTALSTSYLFTQAGQQ